MTDAFRTDPFPKIPAALLNSSDIHNYYLKTRLIEPFDITLLKPASYAIRVGDRVIFWAGREKSLVDRKLADREKFVVPANTIAFVKTKEKFKLPPYIAMRFDLKINNAHRGLLRGSGPLVDPGFEGYLLVPLHNLTSNDYTFREGDKFLWAEFTKVSPHQSWDSSVTETYRDYSFDRSGDRYLKFPDDKKNLTPWDYIADAEAAPIISSISNAEARLKDVESRQTKLTWIAALTGIGILVAVFVPIGIAYTDHELAIEKDVADMQATAKQADQLATKLTHDVQAMRTQFTNSSSFETLVGRVSTLETQIHEMQNKAAHTASPRR